MNKTKIQSAVVVWDGRLVTEKMHISQTEDSNPQSSSHCTKKDQLPYLSIDQLSRHNLNILKQEKAFIATQQIVDGTSVCDKWLHICRSGHLSVKRLHKYKRIFNVLILITLKAS